MCKHSCCRWRGGSSRCWRCKRSRWLFCGQRLELGSIHATGYYRSNNAYRDRWASLGLSAYLEPYLQSPWVLQAEMRWSQSHPGSVDTRQQFLALSWGRHGQTVLTGRHGWGREGWQLLGDARSIVDFASRQDTLTVQHWLAPQWGLKLVADHYRNDNYRRRGLNLAVFREWP